MGVGRRGHSKRTALPWMTTHRPSCQIAGIEQRLSPRHLFKGARESKRIAWVFEAFTGLAFRLLGQDALAGRQGDRGHLRQRAALEAMSTEVAPELDDEEKNQRKTNDHSTRPTSPETSTQFSGT